MSEYYMIVKPDSELYKDYFEYLENRKEVNEIFGRMQEKFGIETSKYYARKDRFSILPTEADKEKFKFLLLKDGVTFRKTCEISKTWVHEVKHIKHMTSPSLFCYCNTGWGRLQSRMFPIGDTLYCSMETEQDVGFPSWGEEIKASEFYKELEGLQ